MLVVAGCGEGYELRKQFFSGGQHENFGPVGTYFQVEHAYTEDEVTLELIHTVITKIENEHLNLAILPNLPKIENRHFDGSWFKREAELLQDSPRRWLQLDLDWDKEDFSHIKTLEQAREAAIDALPFLSDEIGMVLQFSSKAGLTKYQKRLSVRVYVLLDKAITSNELKQAFSPYEGKGERGFIDLSMMQSSRFHFVSPPLLHNTKRVLPAETVKLFDGAPLNTGKLLAEAPVRPKEYSETEYISFSRSRTHDEIEAEIDKKAAEGYFSGNRWNGIFPFIHRWVFFRWGDPTIIDMMDKPAVLGDSGDWDRKHLIYAYKKAEGYLRDRFVDTEFSGFDEMQIMKEKDLKNAEFSIPDVGHFLVCSGCGSGKTEAIIEQAIREKKPQRLLYIGARKSYIEKTCLKHNIPYYMPDMKRDQQVVYMQMKDWLGTCSPSVGKLFDDNCFDDGWFKPFEMVIVDEVEMVALEAATKHDQAVSGVANKVFALCSMAKLGIYLDASATSEISGWFVKEVAKTSNNRAHLLRNKADYMEGMRVFQVPTEEEATATIEHCLEQDQRVYIHTGFGDQREEKKLSRLHRYLTKKFPNKRGLYFDAKSIESYRTIKTKPDLALRAELEDGLDWFICSPWNVVGWSYLPTDNNRKPCGPDFDVSVGIYPSLLFQADEIVQAIRRCRMTDLHFVFVNREKNYVEKNWIETHMKRAYPHLVRAVVDKGFEGELKQRALKRKKLCASNLALHLELLCKERGALWELSPLEAEDFTTPLSEIREALGLEAEAAFREEVIEILSDKMDNRRVAKAFGLKEMPSDIEEAKELVARYKSVNCNDIQRLMAIWSMTEEERIEADLRNDEVAAWYIGRIADAVSDALRPFTGEPFPSWFFDDEKRRFHYLIHKIETRDLAVLYEERLSDMQTYFDFFPKKLSTFRESPYKVFDDFLEYLDCEVTKLEKAPQRIARRNKLFRAYEKAGKFGKGHKKIKGITARMKFADDLIDKKIKNGTPLTAEEKAYHRTRGDSRDVRKPQHQFEKLKSRLSLLSLSEMRD